ncbi:MAG: tetratricopeptide repeat protein [Acidobacteria bacterium]|nr:tetratricopeptide repeat protein [Acidobacteriota bacterium]
MATRDITARRLAGLGITLVLVGGITAGTASAQSPLTEVIRMAELGDAAAQYNVGFSYAYGTGLPRNDERAVAWYRLAAEQGHAAAQHHLGVMYANGEGTPQDFTEAIEWLRKAAAQNYSTARYYLGVMYANGEGVPQDDGDALAWFQDAAAEGEAPAMYMLGVMYGDGVGSTRPSVVRPGGTTPGVRNRRLRSANHVEAYKWLSLAASHVTDEEQRFYATVRDRTARRLSADEIAEAQQLAGEWQAAFEQRQAE